MKLKLVAVAAFAVIASPAFADFYVVQNTASKSCTITEQKPTQATMMVVGGPDKSYKTRDEAERDMKSAAACQPGTTGASPGAMSPSTPSPAPSPSR
jgi:hypothetical protein